MDCKVRPSVHARDMMTERGVSKIEALETINKGAKKLHKNKITTFHRGIEVVFKKKPCNIFIITIYRSD